RAALWRLRLGLLLRPILELLVTWREGLRIPRQVRLRLRFPRRVARLVLPHVRLAVIIVAVKAFIGRALRLPALATLLRLLIVVGVLLTKLFLCGGDQAEIVFGVLIIILGRNRIAGTLRIASKLDIFFRNMRCGTTDLHVWTVRLINARQRVLTLAVVSASPHALLTVSHDVPVRRPFTFFRHSPPNVQLNFRLPCSTSRTKFKNPVQHSNTSHCAAGPLSCPRQWSNRCVRYRDSRSNPIATVSAAALPTSRYAHRPRFRKMMRPTGEASRPVSGDFVWPSIQSRLFVIRLAPHLTERFAPGFMALQPSRVDSVTGS